MYLLHLAKNLRFKKIKYLFLNVFCFYISKFYFPLPTHYIWKEKNS